MMTRAGAKRVGRAWTLGVNCLPVLAAMALITVVGCSGKDEPFDLQPSSSWKRPTEDLSQSSQAITFAPMRCNQLPASGCPAAGTTDSSKQMHECLNQYRRAQGLNCMIYNDFLAASAQHHGHYEARHLQEPACRPDGTLHVENPACSGFHGAHFWERNTWEGFQDDIFASHTEVATAVYANFTASETPGEAMQAWMNSVYHSIVGKDSIANIGGGAVAIEQGGVGETFSSGVYETADPLFCKTTDFDCQGNFRMVSKWPWSEAQSWPRAWNAKESPQPPGLPGDGSGSGPVTSLIKDDFSPSWGGPLGRFGTGIDWSLWEWNDAAHGGSTQLDVVRYDWQHDATGLLAPGEYYMVPKGQLKANWPHVVHMTGNRWYDSSTGRKCHPFQSGCSGTVETIDWMFYTGPF